MLKMPSIVACPSWLQPALPCNNKAAQRLPTPAAIPAHEHSGARDFSPEQQSLCSFKLQIPSQASRIEIECLIRALEPAMHVLQHLSLDFWNCKQLTDAGLAALAAKIPSEQRRSPASSCNT
eukprot:TRINITY_DN24705_c0_g1_i5.p1 TRINITY_DN24705_c0_g1~~TRINITY_DN24705_c0_g1_i5.p1  ORF type:complete len:133 (-),score=38.31 TRINITY_DN24705_c0_g1_i5:535-900(-)